MERRMTCQWSESALTFLDTNDLFTRMIVRKEFSRRVKNRDFFDHRDRRLKGEEFIYATLVNARTPEERARHILYWEFDPANSAAVVLMCMPFSGSHLKSVVAFRKYLHCFQQLGSHKRACRIFPSSEFVPW